MKAVFITGGTSGIGLELARLYLAKGWKVGVCGRDRIKFEENFNQQERISFYQVDVSQRTEVKVALGDFSKTHGLDLMIANAGIGYKVKSAVPDFDYSYKMVQVNLLGVMHSFEAALDIMIPRGRGQLVAISSLAGLNGLPGVSAYSGTKAAVIKYAESLHLDLKKFNVDVTVICPGFVETPFTSTNRHPMPFLLKAPQAAQMIFKAIEKKKMIYAFPFFFASVVRFLSIIPRTWYRLLITKKSFDYSRES